MGERLLCKQNVGGSIPSTSTKFRTNSRSKWLPTVNGSKMLGDPINPNHRLHLVKILKLIGVIVGLPYHPNRCFVSVLKR